jgi:hypothetical protein
MLKDGRGIAGLSCSGTALRFKGAATKVKAARTARKANGVKFGNSNLHLAQVKAAAASRAAADAHMAKVLPALREIQMAGDALSLKALAARLNARGVPTARGARWHSTTVRALLQRAGLPTKLKVTRYTAFWE